MKKILTKKMLVGFLSCLFSFSGSSQGFVNLDFESATIIPLTDGALFPPYSVATTNALPSWSVAYGANQQTQITYNNPAVGSTFATLWATNGQQIGGNYSLLLQGGLTASGASVSQTGLVPISAMSLLFQAQPSSGAAIGSLTVSLGGQNIPFFAISVGGNYTLYGGDISAYAGQTQALVFSALHGLRNNWNIDNIQFSTVAVPEPTSLGLLGLGGLGFWLVKKRQKRGF